MRYRIEQEKARHCDVCDGERTTMTFTLGRRGSSKTVRICAACWAHVKPDANRVQVESDPGFSIEVDK